MTEAELRGILKAVETALEAYRKYEGKLTASEISVKSMLMAVRLQISDQLTRERVGARG